jgi:hypothetical protein
MGMRQKMAEKHPEEDLMVEHLRYNIDKLN